MKRMSAIILLAVLIAFNNDRAMAESPPAVPAMPPDFQSIKISKPDPAVPADFDICPFQKAAAWEPEEEKGKMGLASSLYCTGWKPVPPKVGQ